MGDTWYLDERFVNIQGRRQYLWRSVDQDGDVIDMLVQSRRNRWAATRFFRKLLKGQGRLPLRLITDKLLSYKAAHRAAKPEVHALSIRANAQGPFAGTHRDNPRCDRQRSRTMGAVGAAARRVTGLRLTFQTPLIFPIVKYLTDSCCPGRRVKSICMEVTPDRRSDLLGGNSPALDAHCAIALRNRRHCFKRSARCDRGRDRESSRPQDSAMNRS